MVGWDEVKETVCMVGRLVSIGAILIKTVGDKFNVLLYLEIMAVGKARKKNDMLVGTGRYSYI